MSTLDTNTHFAAIEPIVQKNFGLEKKTERQFSKVFDVSKGKEAVRYSIERGGPATLGLKTENGAVQQYTIRAGSRKSWLYALYAGQMTMSVELARDNRVREIETCAREMGRATTETPEYLASQFLDRAFNSSYPATADSVELCSTAHLIVGTNASTGQNELSTPAALSEESLEDVLTALRAMKYSDGNIRPYDAKGLIVPSALYTIATKLSRSEKTLGSANNDPSVVKGIKVLPMDRMEQTAYWFVKTDAMNGLFWEWDAEATFQEDNSITTLQKVYVAWFRARWGCDDWRGIYGSAMT